MPSSLNNKLLSDEFDFEDDWEPSSPDNNPLAFVKSDILEALKSIDLSKCIDIKSKKVFANGVLGDVFRGHLTISSGGKTVVALKQLRLCERDEIKEIFEKEVYVWSKLHHANVLPLLGYAFDEMGYPMFVSQLMRSGSAKGLIKDKKDYDLMRLVVGTAEGLKYLHYESYKDGVVHSDIKPDNILISRAGDALICDFGCARMIEASRSLGLMTYREKGTERYLAYEIMQSTSDKTPYSKAADVWAFGMTVLELFTRDPPYNSVNDADSKIKGGILPERPLSIDTDSTGIKELLWGICQRCWILDPIERINVKSIVEELKDFQEGKPTYFLKNDGDFCLGT